MGCTRLNCMHLKGCARLPEQGRLRMCSFLFTFYSVHLSQKEGRKGYLMKQSAGVGQQQGQGLSIGGGDSCSEWFKNTHADTVFVRGEGLVGEGARLLLIGAESSKQRTGVHLWSRRELCNSHLLQ